MTAYARHLGIQPVPQSEPLPGQVQNSSGGYAFLVDDWARLDRFLVLGAEGGTYYASERKLVLQNAAVVERLAELDDVRVVSRIVEISESGRAPKNDAALLALAICLKRGSDVVRNAAGLALPMVARTGTHLFHLAEYVKALEGGWGRGTKRAFQSWYTKMTPEKLALQAIKYQQRDGWSHRDILRKCHIPVIPAVETGDSRAERARAETLRWMVKGWPSVGPEVHPDQVLRKIWAFERAKTAVGKELVKLIADHGLPHECVPNETKSDPAVWEAMLPSMGLTAMVRNLGKMTQVGLLKPLSASTKFVCDALTNQDLLKKGRVHPMALLIATTVYQQGHGEKGKLSWTPVSKVTDAVNAGFYKAFGAVTPSGKRTLLALDCSGSMTWDSARIAGTSLHAREASAAMAVVTMATEPECAVVSFSAGLGGISPLDISASDKVTTAVQRMARVQAGYTDCSLPMKWALANKVDVDTFVVYTDNETNHGEHPSEALRLYRRRTGIPAKLVVVGMAANEFMVADPADGGMMDVIGFDAAAPTIISDFSRGSV
jgi:60 kDa SS-A/Ro ribonucleoprotein